MVSGKTIQITIQIDSNEHARHKPYEDYLRKVAKELNQSVEVMPIPAGDVLIGKILFEYKTPEDFMSYTDGQLRIFKQATKLKEFREKGFQPIVTIVGQPTNLIRRWKKKYYTMVLPQMMGVINSLQIHHEIPVYWFRSQEEFFVWLRTTIKGQVASRGLVKYSLRGTPKYIQDIEEEIFYIIQGIRGIGGSRSYDFVHLSESESLIDALAEISHPVKMVEDPETGEITTTGEPDIELIKKWQAILGFKTYDHIQKVLLYPFKNIRKKEENNNA